MAALDHYKRMLDTCHGLGVTPVLTYNHFTLPRWMAGRGGWTYEEAPERFAEFATRATEHLGDRLSWVGTLNEPNLMAMLTSTGVIPMGVSERGMQESGVDTATAGVGGYDPARYRMGLLGADVATMARAQLLATQAIKSTATSRWAGHWRSSRCNRHLGARSVGPRFDGSHRLSGLPSRRRTTSSACRPIRAT